MMKQLLRQMLLLILIFMGSASQGFSKEIVVISNSSFPLDSLSKIQLIQIYTGYQITIHSITTLKPLDQGDDQAIKPFFLDKLLEYTLEEYKDYWSRWKFKTGRMPPTIKPSSKEIIQAVLQERGGALGYVWDDEIQGVAGIKVLFRMSLQQ
jgi:hypothetical protein